MTWSTLIGCYNVFDMAEQLQPTELPLLCKYLW